MNTKDLEAIESIIRKYDIDNAVNLSRSLERLEERIDAMESRLTSRMSEIEDRLVVGFKK